MGRVLVGSSVVMCAARPLPTKGQQPTATQGMLSRWTGAAVVLAGAGARRLRHQQRAVGEFAPACGQPVLLPRCVPGHVLLHGFSPQTACLLPWCDRRPHWRAPLWAAGAGVGRRACRWGDGLRAGGSGVWGLSRRSGRLACGSHACGALRCPCGPPPCRPVPRWWCSVVLPRGQSNELRSR